ncbi:MAG: ATPase, partial [Elusimicrobia bacterium]|nr:ATPase [Elusimicrobiota bacterium]
MAQRGIREYDGKRILFNWLAKDFPQLKKRAEKLALVTPENSPEQILKQHPWLKTEKLVVKPDQLFGKRGKHGLICLNADWETAWKWISDRMNKPAKVGKTEGKLTHFMIEPFTPHAENEEWYAAIKSERENDIIYFSTKGGIYVEENWDKVVETKIPVLSSAKDVEFKLGNLGKRGELAVKFLRSLHALYAEGGFSYIEINPFTFSGDEIVPLDLVAKVDDTAGFECEKLWGDLEFPSSFGEELKPEERFIKEI